MSLQLIVGPSGSGKSHYLYEHIIKEAKERTNQQYVILVPDQYTMQAKRDFVNQSPQKGMLNVDVLSFGRLAHRVFEETGQSNRMLLDDTGKNFVLKKIARKQEGNLKVLRNNLNKIGYMDEVKSVISELTQYGVGEEALSQAAKALGTENALSYKLQDFALLYREFYAYLEEKYITSEEMLSVLCQVIFQSAFLKDSVIVLDGFTGFTPVQMKVLRELALHCEKIYVSVLAGAHTNLFVYEHPYQLYALSKQMVTGLLQLARETGIEVEPEVRMEAHPSYRLREKKALSYLQQHLFTYGAAPYEEEQNEIALYGARDAREEMGFVAQEIRKLVRQRKYRYREIGVIVSDMDTYQKAIEGAFRTYDLPVFMDSKRSILLNGLVEYIRSLLEMVEQNFAYTSVFRYLRTGLTEFTEEEVDRMENYVLARGIRGYKKWAEPWTVRTGFFTEEDVAELEGLRSRFMERRQEVFGVLKSRNKTVYQVTLALHNFFVQEQLQQKMKTSQEWFEAEGELVLAREYAQIYRIVMDLFDKFVELLGEERISMKEYCELLDAGLAQARVGTVPPGMDQIVVGDIERTRLPEVKVLFLVGMSDAYIPGNLGEGGLLSDADRSTLAKRGVTLAPGAKEKLYVQRFYLHMHMSKPSELLYLTYCRMKGEKDTMRPSYVIGNLRQLFPKLELQEVPQDPLLMEQTAESGLSYVIRGLREEELRQSPMWKEWYRWYQNQPEWQEKIEQILTAAFLEKPEGTLGKELAQQLYGKILKNSVTRLETFTSCAYAHFVEYGLDLREREEYEFRSLDFGTMFHRALELYAKKLKAREQSWTEISEPLQEQIVGESIAETLEQYASSIISETARDGYVKNRLARMMKRTIWAMTNQLRSGEFVPVAYEVAFGKETGLSVCNLELEEGNRMILRGKIDRIDICEQEDAVYVKVTDYKTGSKLFDISDLYQGLQMQLATYMLVALDMEQKRYPKKEILPAGIFYYRIQDPLVPDGDEAAVSKAIMEKLCPDGMVNSQEEILHLLDREMEKESEVIPVKRGAKGNLLASSKVMTTEEFQLVNRYALEKMKQAGNAILQGNVEQNPYRKGQKSSCSYCPYKGICKFDPKITGYAYRELEAEKKEEIINKIREEAETWE